MYLDASSLELPTSEYQPGSESEGVITIDDASEDAFMDDDVAVVDEAVVRPGTEACPRSQARADEVVAAVEEVRDEDGHTMDPELQKVFEHPEWYTQCESRMSPTC